MSRFFILKSVFLILAVSMTTGIIYAQNRASDAAFGRGVELYGLRKYAEAIPFFQKADSLDALYLPEGSSAAIYPSVWMANCFFLMGDTVRARELHPNDYMLPPVDRRLVEESDAFSDDAFAYIQAEDLESALGMVEQCGAIECRVLGEKHYYYGNTLFSCAGILTNLERYEEAITCFERAIDIFAGYDFRYGLADSYIGMASVYVAMDSVDRAFEFYDKALPLLDKLDPTLEVASLWADASTFFADYCYDYYTALGCTQRCFAIADSLAPHDGIFYADACNAMGTCLCNIAEAMANENDSKQAHEAYCDAFAYCAHADSLYRLLEETDPYYYAQNLYCLALSGCKSEQPGHQALVREAAYLWRSEEMEPFSGTTTAYSMMRLYVLCNPDTLTLEVAIEGLDAMAHELFESEDADLQVLGVDLLMDILTAFQSQGDHQQLLRDNLFLVDEIGQRLDSIPSVSAYERAHYYLAYAKTLNMDLGDSERALEVLQRAKENLDEEGADTTHVYREVLSQLGQICTNIGRYYEAFIYLSQLIDLSYTSVDYHSQRITEMGIDASDYVNALLNMSIYFDAIGDLQRAAYILGLAHGLQVRAGQEAGISTAYLLYCARNNQLDKALRLYEEFFSAEYDNTSSALERFTAHAFYAVLLLGAGNRVDEAEQQLDLALAQDVLEDLPAYHEMALQYGYLRAILAYQRGDLDAASEKLEQVVAAAEAAEVINLGTLANFYADLLACYLQQGDIQVAERALQRCTEVLTGFVRTTFRSMNYTERSAFWSRYSQWYTATLPATAYRMQSADVDTLLYNAVLMSKGLLLNSEIELKRLIANTGDPAAIALYDSLQALYTERKQLTDDREAYNQLSLCIENGEREIVNLVKSYGDYTKNITLTWRDVKDALSPEDAAIEFVVTPLNQDSLMYSALVLKSGSEPYRVDLCSQNQLTEIPTDSLYTTTELTSLIWDPLEEELRGVDNVYFAPQGLLYSTAIEYAPTGDGYISDKYNLYRVSSTREIVLPYNQNEAKSAVLYGGLNYSADTVAVIKVNSDQTSLDVFKPRAVLEDIRYVSPQGISDLAYTLEEVEQIENLHSAAQKDCHSFKGIYGTEESFKKLSGTGKTLLHLATHGFYYTQTDYDKNNSFLTQAIGMLDGNLISTEDKMLTRSGLFLTGVNVALTGQSIPKTMEDGILTAQEISLLDFRDVDLVVLSACKSAMGELTGDGVFGLQRGFKKAGAHTLLMSLWNVDDRATKLLMTEFYKNWLGVNEKRDAMSKREAFLKAQEYLRTTENGRYKDPKYWAAFVMLDGIN